MNKFKKFASYFSGFNKTDINKMKDSVTNSASENLSKAKTMAIETVSTMKTAATDNLNAVASNAIKQPINNFMRYIKIGGIIGLSLFGIGFGSYVYGNIMRAHQSQQPTVIIIKDGKVDDSNQKN
jgi:hypothetical protein